MKFTVWVGVRAPAHTAAVDKPAASSLWVTQKYWATVIAPSRGVIEKHQTWQMAGCGDGLWGPGWPEPVAWFESLQHQMALPRAQSIISHNHLGTARNGSLAQPLLIKWCIGRWKTKFLSHWDAIKEQNPTEEAGKIPIKRICSTYMSLNECKCLCRTIKRCRFHNKGADFTALTNSPTLTRQEPLDGTRF